MMATNKNKIKNPMIKGQHPLLLESSITSNH